MWNQAAPSSRIARAVRPRFAALFGVLAAMLSIGGFACFPCDPPTIPDSSARAPILAAPLFREPAGDSEASNAEHLRLLLEERSLGISNGLTYESTGFPESSYRVLRRQLSELTYRPASSPGGRIAAEGLSSQLVLFDWSSDGEQLIETQRFDYPDECWGGQVRWIDERYLVMRQRCANDVLLDTATGAWTNAMIFTYFSNGGALDSYRDGLVTTAAGETFAVASCPPNLFFNFNEQRLTARYYSCWDGSLIDYRSGEQTILLAPTGKYDSLSFFAIAPSATKALIFDSVRNVMRLFDLTTPAPALLREIALPENQDLRLIDWRVDDDTLLASMLYSGDQYFIYPPCGLDLLGTTGPAYVSLLIDLAGGRVFQFAQLGAGRSGRNVLGFTAFYGGFLFRTRTQ